jgi:hypothetical protein
VKCYIDNFVSLRSCIRNVNKHFWRRSRGGRQYLLSVFKLHGIILANIISLTDLSAALCLFMVFTGSCMTRFDLPTNYHSDQESLIRKSRSRLSSPGSSGLEVSALSSANVRTGPEMNIGDGSYELKPALINMVQQSPFCGKASEDANAHLQHQLEICSTFTIRGVTQDAVRLRIFPFSLLGKAKQ